MDYRDENSDDISLHLSDDVVDENGLAICYDTTTSQSNEGPDPELSEIAPWLDMPDPVPPPSRKSSHKSPFAALSFRSGSRGSRSNAPAESSNTLRIPSDSKRRSTDEGDSQRGLGNSGSSSHSTDLRKAKSSIGLNLFRLRSRSSKSHLRQDSEDREGSQGNSSRPPMPKFPSKYKETSTGTIIHIVDPDDWPTRGASGKDKGKGRERKMSTKEREQGKEKTPKPKKTPLNMAFSGFLGGSSKQPPSPTTSKKNPSADTYGRVPGEAGREYSGDLNLDDLVGVVDFKTLAAAQAEAEAAAQYDREVNGDGGPSSYTIIYPAHPDYEGTMPFFIDPWIKGTSQDAKRKAVIVAQAKPKPPSPTTVEPSTAVTAPLPTAVPIPWVPVDIPEAWGKFVFGNAGAEKPEYVDSCSEGEITESGDEEEVIIPPSVDETQTRKNSTTTAIVNLGWMLPKKKRKAEVVNTGDKLPTSSSTLSLVTSPKKRMGRKFSSRPAAHTLAPPVLATAPSNVSLDVLPSKTTGTANAFPAINPIDILLDLPNRQSRLQTANTIERITETRLSNDPSALYPTHLKVRVGVAGGRYHLASLKMGTDAQQLSRRMRVKVKGEKSSVPHELLLTELGRERILGNNESPAEILARRLINAGYDYDDALHLLTPDNLGMIMKLNFKVPDLSGKYEITYTDWQSVDVSGRGLRTVPIALYKKADLIVSLKMSRNPMTVIPIDFIKACSVLRELKLSNMGLKRVPHSVETSETLHRLDVSSNFITDLDEPLLEEVKLLRFLNAQNNRLEKIPWYLPRLLDLVVVNLSHNHFTVFPEPVTFLVGITELDVSFNKIIELPECVGNMTTLHRLLVVHNEITTIHTSCNRLVNLRHFDCRRNRLSDLRPIRTLPLLTTVMADHNLFTGFELPLSTCLASMSFSHNNIDSASILITPHTKSVSSITALHITHANLTSMEMFVSPAIPAIRELYVQHNNIRTIPENIDKLLYLETLVCSNNKIERIPASISNLPNLKTLDAHNNCLSELPREIWNCGALQYLNVTSNSIQTWYDAPPVTVIRRPTPMPAPEVVPAPPKDSSKETKGTDTKGTKDADPKLPQKPTLSPLFTDSCPPLAHSLKCLYIGENNLKDNSMFPLAMLFQLKVLNLSYNELQNLPPDFLHNMLELKELYLSGNKLTSIPTEDLGRLTMLRTLYLNGNKLQTLPQELTNTPSLTTLDVGSNLLRYNTNNYEFDWNWNFNENLRYLNFSGNSRFQIKPEQDRISGIRTSQQTPPHPNLSGFTGLPQLRVLGLMDVTITTTSKDNRSVDIPDETADRRVRTSTSTIGGMAYGIADSMGRNTHPSMLDLVHEFQGKGHLSIFAIFGRVYPAPIPAAQASSPNLGTKFIHDNFLPVFLEQISACKRAYDVFKMGEVSMDSIPKALQWTFLKLNQDLYSMLRGDAKRLDERAVLPPSPPGRWESWLQRTGTTANVLLVLGKTLICANIGDSLAVLSRAGVAQSISRKHDPFDSREFRRIREGEATINDNGLVNGEVDVSRAFGFFHMSPPVNARPDIFVHNLTEQDEFVIIANRSLWDHVSYQTAVDIARDNPTWDVMYAAQKLRDLAISYGADGSIMVMIVRVSDLFQSAPRRRQPTLDPIPENRLRLGGQLLHDREFRRLGEEVPAPTGHITLVFTDIRNSTHLWEANPGIQAALRIHNHLLRRQLRICGGYEVKTEGDSFMCSFPSALAGLWWCLSVQKQLMDADWPLEILECEDGKEITVDGFVIARGLSVRMGIHSGVPLICEPDPITNRMDYFGTMVNRSARIMGSAQGGQILCSLDVMKEINARIYEIPDSYTEYSNLQSPLAVEAIKAIGIETFAYGVKVLKGLELPETLTAIYPRGLEKRLVVEELSATNVRVQFSVTQMRELGILCLRIEALSAGRVFKEPNDKMGIVPFVPDVIINPPVEETANGKQPETTPVGETQPEVTPVDATPVAETQLDATPVEGANAGTSSTEAEVKLTGDAKKAEEKRRKAERKAEEKQRKADKKAEEKRKAEEKKAEKLAEEQRAQQLAEEKKTQPQAGKKGEKLKGEKWAEKQWFGQGEEKAGGAKVGEVKAGEVKAGEVKAGEVNAGEVKAGEVKAGEVKEGEVKANEKEGGQQATEPQGGMPEVKAETKAEVKVVEVNPIYFISNASLLLPAINDRCSDTELNLVLHSLSARISNAVHAADDRYSSLDPEDIPKPKPKPGKKPRPKSESPSESEPEFKLKPLLQFTPKLALEFAVKPETKSKRKRVPRAAPKPVRTGIDSADLLARLKEGGELDDKTLEYLRLFCQRLEEES